MRVGEVQALRIGDVLLETGREGLRVREPKNRTERIVVLGATATPNTIRGLRAHLKQMQIYLTICRAERRPGASCLGAHQGAA